MLTTRHRPRSLTWLLALSAAATLAATIPTFFAPDLLNGPAVMNGSARGTALIMLVLGVPLLLASLALEHARWRWWPVLRTGALAYLAYNDFLLLFATPFNRLFLVYVLAMSSTAFALGMTLLQTDADVADQRLPRTAAHVIGGYVLTIAVLNTLIWLRTVVPATFAEDPTSFLAGMGIATQPVYVQDLVFWLPSTAVVGWLAWTRRRWGATLAGAYLVYAFIEAIGVATDQWMGSSADPTSPVATMGGVTIFAVMTVLGAIALAYYARAVSGIRPRATRDFVAA